MCELDVLFYVQETRPRQFETHHKFTSLAEPYMNYQLCLLVGVPIKVGNVFVLRPGKQVIRIGYRSF